MKQYIDKDRILAEIERRKNQFVSQAESFHKIGMEDKESYYAALASNMNSLSCFLNTLEVKEVDLENLFQALPEKIADEKSHQVYELSIYHYDGQCVVDYVGEIDHDSLYTFGGNTLYEAIEKAWNWLSKNSTGG